MHYTRRNSLRSFAFSCAVTFVFVACGGDSMNTSEVEDELGRAHGAACPVEDYSCSPGEEGGSVLAPTVPNHLFSQITSGVPSPWSTSCPWGQYIYADSYGESRSGAVLFTMPGCTLVSGAAAVATGAGSYVVNARYKVESGIDQRCTNCLRLAARWESSTGTVLATSQIDLPATGGVWATGSVSTTKPTNATRMRIVLVGLGTTSDSVYVDGVEAY